MPPLGPQPGQAVAVQAEPSWEAGYRLRAAVTAMRSALQLLGPQAPHPHGAQETRACPSLVPRSLCGLGESCHLCAPKPPFAKLLGRRAPLLQSASTWAPPLGRWDPGPLRSPPSSWQGVTPLFPATPQGAPFPSLLFAGKFSEGPCAGSSPRTAVPPSRQVFSVTVL